MREHRRNRPLPQEEWEQGLYRVLPIHAEVERDGLLA